MATRLVYFIKIPLTIGITKSEKIFYLPIYSKMKIVVAVNRSLFFVIPKSVLSNQGTNLEDFSLVHLIFSIASSMVLLMSTKLNDSSFSTSLLFYFFTPPQS